MRLWLTIIIRGELRIIHLIIYKTELIERLLCIMNYLFFNYLQNKIRSLFYSGLCWYLILMCFSKLRRKIINFSYKFYTHRVFLILAKRFSYHYLPNFIQYFGEKVKLDITILLGKKSRTLLFMRDRCDGWLMN